jgi:hypothetical protein
MDFITSYVKRHRNKIATVGVITSACYMLSHFLKNKISEYEERAFLEQNAKEK